MKCCICQEEIKPDMISGYAKGHNAEPVRAGRCCAVCNYAVVVPARLGYAHMEKEKENAALGRKSTNKSEGDAA